MKVVVKFDKKELAVFATMLTVLTKTLGWNMNADNKREKQECLQGLIDTCPSPDDFTKRVGDVGYYRQWLRNLKKHNYEQGEDSVMDFMTAHIMAVGKKEV